MNPQIQQVMLNYPMMYPQVRAVYPNQVQIPYTQFAPQTFYQRMIPNQMPMTQTQPYMIPPIVNQAQIQMQNVPNEIKAENPSSKGESNPNPEPMKILTKYKDIYVPSIFLLDYTDKNKEPFNTFIQNQQQQAQNPQMFNKYFNYGYNFEQWKKYVAEIRSKFDELNELVKSKTIILPSPENELEYLMAFPSDYGGLGDIHEDQKYENLKLYDPKDASKNKDNKSFMDLIKFDHDTTWFPLEPNPQSLNKYNYNDIFKNINHPVIPSKIPNNFLNQNQNQQTIATKTDSNINGSNGGDTKNGQNEKE
jgi:hypothetical protein